MLQKGIAVSLGTDAGNNSNLLETQRSMYLAAVLLQRRPAQHQHGTAETALEMAT
jgi:cytosine/adenosine deaminase-related metal-dependent hydrolase